MKRREFIIQTGTIISASVLFPGTILAGSKSAQTLVGSRRPNPDNYPQPIMKAISMGMNAPNPHNSQAWKFKILSDFEALLYLDESRLLHATDPPGRQIHIGCGCFLETLRLGASTLGYTAKYELLPEGEYPLEEAGLKPVAFVKVAASATEPLPLSDSIFSRQTNRSLYEGELMTNSEFDSITALTTAKYSELSFHSAPERLKEMVDILYEGMVVEANTHVTYDESRIWFRSSQKKIETKRDGINLRTDGTKGLLLSIMEFIVNEENEESWHKPTAINAFLKSYGKKIYTAKGIVLFKTQSNTMSDWILTGIDYVRFQLAADQLGYVIHPVSQVLQEYPEMDDLRARFNGLVGVSEPSKIQMGVRIGRGEKLYYSYRREPENLLI
ncbi:MAG: hypothetical protein H8E26_11525 [FCB group bacterium]|nr:hypothetical protein [FCB group bacterium]MBL7028590.1 hypothetical protein [Candidatus Neomarinimicrobiota bacterium]MBL7120809.1 hypothetical protein [Candidatus Neomarinimicrobiota bacterium]